MALYFDTTLDCPSGSASTCLSWHEQHDIIAVGYCLPEGKGGIISCYNKQVLCNVKCHNYTSLMTNSLKLKILDPGSISEKPSSVIKP